MSVRHLAGDVNIPSDFASRNAPECENSACQICSFISQLETITVLSVSVADVMSGSVPLPFTSRPAWLATQADCPDLRRVHDHLTQGTRPSKKLTNINDVKRYLHVSTLAKDGLLVVKRDEAFAAPRECIIVPRRVLSGLVTALHLRLNHPSCHQLKQICRRYFYALDIDKTIRTVTDACHECKSLCYFPSAVLPQSTGDVPSAICSTFSADVLRQFRQLVLVVCECVSGYTVACFVDSEKMIDLRAALVILCCQLKPIEGDPVVVRCDSAPGFVALKNDPLLQRIGIRLEYGRVKNPNKNPVGERAIQELEYELKREVPEGGRIPPVQLALAVARLNSRIRASGMSAREVLYQRDQYTNQQLPISDHDLILQQHKNRLRNHSYSEKCKAPRIVPTLRNTISVGDIIHLQQDGNKLLARPRYLVTSINGDWCTIRKFIKSQFRSAPYKVHVAECLKPMEIPNQIPDVSDDDENLPHELPTDYPDPQPPPPSPPPVPDVISQPLPDPVVPSSPGSTDTQTTNITAPVENTQALRKSSRVRKEPERYGVWVSDF